MAQFKRDRKISFLSPLTSMHNFSKIRSHTPEVSGRDFATLFMVRMTVMIIGWQSVVVLEAVRLLSGTVGFELNANVRITFILRKIIYLLKAMLCNPPRLRITDHRREAVQKEKKKSAVIGKINCKHHACVQI